MISFTARERKRLLINKIMLSDPAAHPVILSYNKLPCINPFQPPSRPSCQWKPNFKQRFHQIHSVHIVLQLVRHDLITGLLVLWGQNYGIQYLVKNAWVLENRHMFTGCTPNPTPLHEFAQFLDCDPPPRPNPVKTCIYPVIGYVMHFLIPPLFTDLHTFYAFFIRTQFLKNGRAPPHLWVRPCLHYDLIFIAAVTQWNRMGAAQIML